MIVKKIVHIEIKDGKRTERELTPEEVEQWKKEHHDRTKKKNKSDTE